MKLKSKNSSSLRDDFFFLVIILSVYFVPLLILGTNVIEDYYLNHFSLLLIANNSFLPFLFFYDLIGPGTTMPLGAGLNYLFLPSLLIKDFSLFFYASIGLSFYLKLNYLKRIFKFFKIDSYIYLLIFFYSFSITFLFQIYLSDSVKTIFSLCILPAIFFYLIKFLDTQNFKYFFKLIFFTSFLMVNSHIIYVTSFIFFGILFTLTNNKFFFLKKKLFYFGIFIFLLVISEEFFRIANEYFISPEGNRKEVFKFKFEHFASGLVFPLKFVEDIFSIDLPFLSKFKWIDNLRFPFGGIIFYFAFYESIRSIIKKKSKNIYYIDLTFLLLVFISFIDAVKYLEIYTTNFMLRDIFNFLSIILFGKFVMSINNKKYLKFVLLICFSVTFLHIVQTVNFKFNSYETNSFNYLKKNKDFEKSDLFNFFSNLENKNSEKTYISLGIWKTFYAHKIGALSLDILPANKKFKEVNLFFLNDLLEYNIFPFNYRFKNSNKHLLRKPTDKMYAAIDPKIDEINNNFFFNIFNINYLLIFDNELSEIDLSKFNILRKVKYDNQKSLMILSLKDSKKKIILSKNTNLQIKADCLNVAPVRCLIFEKNLKMLKQENIEFTRIKLNKYKIINNSNKKAKFVLPFLYDKSWKSSEGVINNLDKTLMYLEISPNTESTIYYRNHTRIILKIVSLLSFFILAFICIRYNKKNLG